MAKSFVAYYYGDQVKTAKHRTDGIDKTNHVFKYTRIEGGVLGEDFELVSNTVKIESGSNGDSTYKSVNTYQTKGNNHHSIQIQEKIKQGKEGANAFFHAVEAYLHAHTYEYN